MQFTTTNSLQIDLDISCTNKVICKACETTFLGKCVDSMLSCKIHTEQITHKLSEACYTVISVEPFMTQGTLRLVYCAYFHSIMNYRLIFWGNSPHSPKILKRERTE
jgi:hypothetical protein